MTNAASLAILLSLLWTCACSKGVEPARAPASGAAVNPIPPKPGEVHFASLEQLTFGGENAEAYWSFDGKELVLQAKRGGAGCDRIYRLPLGPGDRELVPVSSGKGATTCSYFMPGNQEIVYASTHLGGDACPPPPDRSRGYVWALYDTYDLYKVAREGGEPRRLTETHGYDAEATVCGRDGSIVFTSVRDGDIDLYRMDADGSNVRRLTSEIGYDGGAFFDADCKRIVWRASRPRPGQELEDYRALLRQGLVRPSKLELYVANADGSEPVQVTYLDAASFAPYWHPAGDRLLFSTNYGDPRGREFDIYAIDVSGARLERVTFAPGFDGFPMFSPDGQTLAFASNRATAPGAHDTNVFIARWAEGQRRLLPSPADRILADAAFLADPAREGRGVGTAGLESSGAYVEKRFGDLGLEPAGDGRSFRQSFAVATALEVSTDTRLRVGGELVPRTDYVPLGFSPSRAEVGGDLVFAGYGVVDEASKVDDYAGVDARGKLVVVRRFVADSPKFATAEAKRRFGDLRYKAWIAKQRGAVGLLIVDAPEAPRPAPKNHQHPAEAPLPALNPEGYGDAGLPAVVLRRAIGEPLIGRLQRRQRTPGELVVALTRVEKPTFNVVGRIRAEPGGAKLPGAIVIGAHYDHLGYGGRYSLAPSSNEPHVGADDNASGTAVLLEIARELASQRTSLRRDVVLAAFSGEESGLLGSAHFVRQGELKVPGALAPADTFAMLNLDMVGRLRGNRVQVLGTDSAAEWASLLEPSCEGARLGCAFAGDGGYGPSDQMSFFVAKVPVLHFFTGSHADYHRPTDTLEKLNAGGAAQIGRLVVELSRRLSVRDAPLTLRESAGPPPRGDLRTFNASLGTIPDYAGPGAGKPGVLLGGVRPGGAADKAGLRRGDLLVKIGKDEIRSIEDLMFVLNSSRPGETTEVTIVRDGKHLSLPVTFQEAQSRPK